jgi:lysophospholipase L1-like esterase
MPNYLIVFLLASLIATPVAVLAQAAPPVIHAITPAQAQAGERVVVAGDNFTNYNQISLQSGSASTQSAAASATGRQLAFTTPRNLPTGTYQVIIQTPYGQSSPVALNITNQSVAFPNPPSPSPTYAPPSPIFPPGPTYLPPTPPNFPPRPVPPITVPTPINPVYPPDLIFPSPTPLPVNPISSPTPPNDCFLGTGFFCPATHSYTAVGDSLNGSFFSFGSYVDLLEDDIEASRGIELELRNLSRPGLTSAQLRQSVTQDPRFRNSLSEADYITWSIGGNDLLRARNNFKGQTCGGSDNQDCLRQAVAEFNNNWDVITSEIATLSKDGAVLRTMDLYNPFVAEDRAAGDYEILKVYFLAVNQHIASNLSQHGIAYAPVSTAFNGPNLDQDPEDLGLISFDGVHPNAAGHRVIADLIRP